MRTGERFWIWTCIIILAVFSIVVSIVYHPRLIEDNNLHFDYIGALVGILAIIVTVLVCWQINQAISARRDVIRASRESMSSYFEFRHKIEVEDRKRKMEILQLERNVLTLYREQLYKEDLPTKLGQFITMALETLNRASMLGEEELSDTICLDIIDCIKESKASTIYKAHAYNIVPLLNSIPNKDKLFYFNEVQSAIRPLLAKAR